MEYVSQSSPMGSLKEAIRESCARMAAFAAPVRRKRACAAGLAVLLLSAPVVTGSFARAELPKLLDTPQAAEKETKPEVKTTDPAQQRDFIRRALAEVQEERKRPVVVPPGITRQEVDERTRLLDGLITRFKSQLNLIDERENLGNDRAAAERKATNWTGFPDKPPYSVLMVDEVRETVLAARAKTRGLESSYEFFSQQISRSKESTKSAREQERQAVDAVDRASTPGERVTATWRKGLAEIRVRTAESLETWAALRYEVLGERLAVARSELGLLERQLTEARSRMIFSRADLEKALARLKANRAMFDRDMEQAVARDARSTGELVRVQRELESLDAGHGKGGGQTGAGARRAELQARQRAAQAWVECSRFEIESISALSSIDQSSASLWEQRYAAITATDSQKKRDILAEFQKRRERFRPWREYAQRQLEVNQAAEREQETRLAGIDRQSPLRAAELDLLAARRLQRDVAERLKVALDHVEAELQSWQEDIERFQGAQSIKQRALDGFGTFTQVLGRIWRFELFTVEDTVNVAGQRVVTSRGVTVGKSLCALLLFIVGFFAASFLGRRMHRIMVTRFHVGEHQAHVLRRAFLALASFILLIVTLNFVRIPLTVFAFLGGALAIGVGFGTQTLIKNLVSGILMLLERNVQVGDTVDVDGVVGKITAVDIRASTVLGFDGVETVIPNSTFLEKNVTNWTHTNARLRRIVKVGVTYGSPVTRVRDILAECGNNHGLVLKDPPPQVFFEDFGDNSLVFALNFWIDYGPKSNPSEVASDLRFMVEQRFSEENIAMVSPQRNIHLDSTEPLRVEVVSPTGPTTVIG